MRQPPGTRRDLQAGTVASPVGDVQQALVARNTVSQIITSNTVGTSRQFTRIQPAQNIAQPNQQSNQAPTFNIGNTKRSPTARPTR